MEAEERLLSEIKQGREGLQQMAAAQAKKDQVADKRAALEATMKKEKAQAAAATARANKYGRKAKPGADPAPAPAPAPAAAAAAKVTAAPPVQPAPLSLQSTLSSAQVK